MGGSARVRRLAASLVVFAAAAARAENGRRSMNYLSVWGARGPSSLVGYGSSSWYAATVGTRAGQSLWTMDVASLAGRPVTGGGVQLGAQSGVVNGCVEIAHYRMSTAAQTAWVDALGSFFDPQAGYADLVSGDAAFPAGYLEVAATSLFVNGTVAFTDGIVQPYLGAGLGASVMHVGSATAVGVDGKALSVTRVGIAFQAIGGVRFIPWEAAFLWLEFRPGWHIMSPFEKGAGYERSRDQFILQLLPIVAGVGWMWS